MRIFVMTWDASACHPITLIVHVYIVSYHMCASHILLLTDPCVHTHTHMQRVCLVMSGCYSNGSYVYASDSRACIAIAIPYTSVPAHTPRLSDQSSYRFGFRCFSYVRTRQEDHADVRPADTITVYFAACAILRPAAQPM